MLTEGLVGLDHLLRSKVNTFVEIYSSKTSITPMFMTGHLLL